MIDLPLPVLVPCHAEREPLLDVTLECQTGTTNRGDVAVAAPQGLPAAPLDTPVHAVSRVPVGPCGFGLHRSYRIAGGALAVADIARSVMPLSAGSASEETREAALGGLCSADHFVGVSIVGFHSSIRRG